MHWWQQSNTDVTCSVRRRGWLLLLTTLHISAYEFRNMAGSAKGRVASTYKTSTTPHTDMGYRCNPTTVRNVDTLDRTSALYCLKRIV